MGPLNEEFSGPLGCVLAIVVGFALLGLGYAIFSLVKLLCWMV